MGSGKWGSLAVSLPFPTRGSHQIDTVSMTLGLLWCRPLKAGFIGPAGPVPGLAQRKRPFDNFLTIIDSEIFYPL